MPLLEKKDGVIVVLGRKHAGKTLEQVAQEDPNYLTWLRTGDRLASVPDDIFYGLQSVMEAFGIAITTRGKR